MAWPGHGQVALGVKPVAQVREPRDPRAMGTGTLGRPWPRHWLRLRGHLAMAWPGRGQAMARSWPGQARQHIFGNDD